ncbi:GIY-YIG catalytic domain-containing endonuclease [Faustovirus]|nr:GIY-YIG catalytic domain-containing endonuclease [Faustovirus]QJX72457.1 GIY-YIG catalytic domain-containing endonuclease [Faustovirus]
MERFQQHLDGQGGARLLYDDIVLYGAHNFQIELLIRCTDDQDDLDINEIEMIRQHNTLTPAGYNIRKGGRRTYRDGIHDPLPRFVWYIPEDAVDNIGNAAGHGYAVQTNRNTYACFAGTAFNLEENYQFAIRFLNANNDVREQIREEYAREKAVRNRMRIVKTIVIDGVEYRLPGGVIWWQTRSIFVVRIAEFKRKEFGISYGNVDARYNAAINYARNPEPANVPEIKWRDETIEGEVYRLPTGLYYERTTRRFRYQTGANKRIMFSGQQYPIRVLYAAAIHYFHEKIKLPYENFMGDNPA